MYGSSACAHEFSNKLLTFMTRVSRDKVFHVHPTTQTSSSEQDGGFLASDGIGLNDVGARYLQVFRSD
jgi:hypothetical protein